ncbi:MAG: DUF1549 domain-containing protein, partial [Pirellulaceae bacterium]
MRFALPSAALLLAALCLPTIAINAQEEKPEPPGLGDPGKLVSVEVETGRSVEGLFIISGRDAGQQLLVTGKYNSGQQRDLGRAVSYDVSPKEIVAIDDTGYVSAIAEGKATIQVKFPKGPSATVKVVVTNIIEDLPINFPNRVVPIFTKFGCNSGGCHGKSSGQNGFRLSLLGFEPAEDFEFLVKEARGRRVFPAAPERSLLLSKASGQLPHGGGHRIAADSPSFRMIYRWIEQGMPYGNEDDPVVTGIVVLPDERLMQRDGSQQVSVVAHYSDGSTEDVTRTTQFDSNDTEMAEVAATGLVTTSRLTGSVAIMARYQGHVGVFRGTVPLGIKVTDLPPVANYVDEIIFEKLTQLGLPASRVSDDATFLRRVTVDIAGRLPTAEEAAAFLASSDEQKRAMWIDHLLESTDYATFFANKWSAILRNKRRNDADKIATFGLFGWIRNSLYENKPYDQFVREIITATGSPADTPAVGWYREVKDQAAQVEDTAQLFL